MNRTCGFADVHLTKSWTEHFKPPLEQMLVIGNRHPISMFKKNKCLKPPTRSWLAISSICINMSPCFRVKSTNHCGFQQRWTCHRTCLVDLAFPDARGAHGETWDTWETWELMGTWRHTLRIARPILGAFMMDQELSGPLSRHFPKYFN